MSKTILVDLSHPFGRGNPLWPSNGDFHIDRVQHMPMHYRLLQTFNDFHMHNSTHADSPSHVIPESPYTHELPLENYYGPAVCLDIPKKHWELITVEDIEKAAAKVEAGPGPHPLYLRGPARPRPLRPPHRGRVQEGVWS